MHLCFIDILHAADQASSSSTSTTRRVYTTRGLLGSTLTAFATFVAIQKEIEAAAQLLVMWEEENPAEAHVVTPEKTQQSTEYRNQQRATQPNARFRNAATIKPQCSAQIIHEVDAAADIIRWELEEENRGSYSMSSTRKPPPPENVPAFNIRRRAPSIADEIAAAADVARWEYEHKEEAGTVCIHISKHLMETNCARHVNTEIVNKPPPRVRQCRIDEPNFQILSSRQSTRPCPPLHSTTMSIVTPSKSNETPQSHSNNRGPLPKKHPANEFTQTVIQTEKVSESRSFGVKPQDEEISHACALSTFVYVRTCVCIDKDVASIMRSLCRQKHFVDEKFEDSVLDFVEMMLS